MVANRHSPIDFESRVFLLAWCLLAGLALAPLPILHAYPIGFLYYLFESAPQGWTRFTSDEAISFSLLGLPLAPIFLAWALPSASRPGVPMRSIVVLCCLVAYNPLRHIFESYLYGDHVARIAGIFSWSESPFSGSAGVWIRPCWSASAPPPCFGAIRFGRYRRSCFTGFSSLACFGPLAPCTIMCFTRVYFGVVFGDSRRLVSQIRMGVGGCPTAGSSGVAASGSSVPNLKFHSSGLKI